MTEAPFGLSPSRKLKLLFTIYLMGQVHHSYVSSLDEDIIQLPLRSLQKQVDEQT
uniref:Uncharacterized protein n=1 Tax=Tetraselmis sp. GSL018 TaxID=582737 RepID=A0A061S3F6_9CHLO